MAAQSWLNHFQLNNPPNVTSGGAIAGQHQGWTAFFGLPETDQKIQPYEASNRSTWTLPAAYKGKSAFFGNTFKLLALSGNNFLTQRILPLMFSNDLSYNWNIIEFPPYLPDVVPELGVTRHVKMNTIAQSASLVRYGIGLQLQHGFMSTPLGVEVYKFHIRQINQAMLEQLQFNALFALLNAEKWASKRTTQTDGWNAQQAQSTLSTVIRREVDSWAITQLRENAAEALDNFIEENNQSYNKRLTTYVMDTRIRTFLKTVAYDQTTYQKYGEGFRENLKEGINYSFKDTMGNTVYCTRKIMLDARPFNPLERLAQIGECFLDHDYDKASYGTYLSSDRTNLFYSENHNSFRPITLQEKVDHSYRFNPENGELWSFNTFPHRKSITEIYSPQDQELDHLHHNVNNSIRPISFFGQMKPHHFPTQDYSNLAETFFASANRNGSGSSKSFNQMFTAISDILDKMHRVPFDDKYNTWLRILAKHNKEFHRNSSNNVIGIAGDEVKSNVFNSLNIPLLGDDAYSTPGNIGALAAEIQGLVLPPTHGSYGGLKTIQAMYQSGQWVKEKVPFSVEYGQRISKALDVFDKMAEQLHTTFPLSTLLAPQQSTDNIHNPSYQDTLFQNIFGIMYPSRILFLKKSGVGAPAASSSSSSSSSSSTQSRAQVDEAWDTIMDTYLGKFSYSPESNQWVYDEIVNPTTTLANTAGINVNALPNTAISVNRDFLIDLRDRPELLPQFRKARTLYEWMMIWALNGLRVSEPIRSLVLVSIAAVKINGEIKDIIDRLSKLYNVLYELTPDFEIYSSVLRQWVQTNRSDITDPDDVLAVYQFISNAPESVVSESEIQPTGDGFYRSPLTIGRAALIDFVEKSATSDVRRYYGYPASNLNSKSLISNQELNTARTIYRQRKGNAGEQINFSAIGYIHDTNPNSGEIADVENLVFIQKLKQPDQNTAIIEQRRQERDFSLRNQSTLSELLPSDRTSELFYSGSAAKRSRFSLSDLGVIEDTNVSALERYTMPLPVPVASLFGLDEITPNMRANFSKIVRELKKAELIVALVFFFTPVIKRSIDMIIKNNILFPWDHICARPHANYVTLTTIKCIPGAETGNTLIGHIEAEASDDTAVHLHSLNVIFYSTAIVHSPENVFVVDNSFVCGYNGGLGTGFIDPEHYDPYNTQMNENISSFMIFSIPRHENLDSRHISICGKPAWYTRDGTPMDLSVINEFKNKFGYSTAPYYNTVWGFQDIVFNSQRAISAGMDRYTAQSIVPNLVCFFSSAIYYSPRTHQPASYTVQQGHWKQHTVGAGARDARLGKVSFDNTPTTYWKELTPISVV